MSNLLFTLTGGDLRSDGKTDEVANTALKNPEYFPLLIEGLHQSDDAVGGRTTHALEKISRTRPELVKNLIPIFTDLALDDDVPMIRWHMAMIFGHLSHFHDEVRSILSVLYMMPKDESAFVKSWAIVSLCILGISLKKQKEQILGEISPLEHDSSVAIQNKVQKAVAVLQNGEKISDGWIKRRNKQK
jgi:hypothetical protein